MCVGGPSVSAPPPPPEPPAPPRKQPRLADEGVRKAREDSTTRNRRANSLNGTLVTGAGGLTSAANTQKKTLLGQ